MMENLFLITLIVILFWIVGFVIYMVISNRQVNLEDRQKKIGELLGDDIGE